MNEVEPRLTTNRLSDGSVARVKRVTQLVQKRNDIILGDVGHNIDVHRASHRPVVRTRYTAANVIA